MATAIEVSANRGRVLTGLLLALLAIGSQPGQNLQAQASPDSLMVTHFIDVGQGSAVLLEFSCGAVMIDAGGQDRNDSRALIEYLRAFFQRRTDLNNTIAAVFITHGHIDHTRSLLDVVQEFTIGHIIENGKRGGPNDPGDRPLRVLAGEDADVTLVNLDDTDVSASFGLVTPEIDPVDCAGTDPEIVVLSADLSENPGWSGTAFANKNNHSLVIRVGFGRSSFLFTGDLEGPAIQTLVDFYRGSPMLDVDVYHVGHHGSANGTTWSLMESVIRPEIAVISMGRCDRNQGQFNAFQFGHPRADIIEILRAGVRGRRPTAARVPVAAGVRMFRNVTIRQAIYGTGWDGTVRVRASRAGAYHVETTRLAGPAVCG